MAFMTKKQRGRKIFPSKYVRLDENKPVVVQVLEDASTEYYKFWLNDRTGRPAPYVSPGYNICPVTERNLAYGKDSKQYIRPGHKWAVNVWDTTPVVRCPQCETPHRPDDLSGSTENMCSNCSVPLEGVEATPYNAVRILERGEQLFDQLSGYAGDEENNIPPRIKNSDGEHLQITEYPVTIIRNGTGRGTTYTLIPMVGDENTVDAKEYQDALIDLPDLGYDFTREEVLAILDDGIPISEILQARESSEFTPSEVSEDDEDSLLY